MFLKSLIILVFIMRKYSALAASAIALKSIGVPNFRCAQDFASGPYARKTAQVRLPAAPLTPFITNGPFPNYFARSYYPRDDASGYGSSDRQGARIQLLVGHCNEQARKTVCEALGCE